MTAPTLINGGQVAQVRLCSSVEESPQNVPVHWSSSSISPRTKLSRYRNMFSTPMSPLTPSFGILPLESNTPEPTVPPTHSTLTEANDQKSLAKRVRAHVGVSVATISCASRSHFPRLFSTFLFLWSVNGLLRMRARVVLIYCLMKLKSNILFQQLISRKETHLQQGKPVFSQSGNASNTANIVTVTATPTPPSPTLQGTNVRRSSRLFSHHHYSVKVWLYPTFLVLFLY